MNVATTARLSLDRLTLDDADFIVKLVNDPQWLTFIGDKAVRTRADAQTYLSTGPLDMYARLGYGLYRVSLRADYPHPDEPIGLCGLVRRDGLDGPDLGFAFLPAGRGRGYALEAAQAVVEHAFRTLALPRILAITLAHNERSCRLLDRLGMVVQGAVRVPADGPDKLLYGLDNPRAHPHA
ncbi:MAG: GNAT family N-acetyltransferase [Ramlibacter sp.]